MSGENEQLKTRKILLEKMVEEAVSIVEEKVEQIVNRSKTLEEIEKEINNFISYLQGYVPAYNGRPSKKTKSEKEKELFCSVLCVIKKITRSGNPKFSLRTVMEKLNQSSVGLSKLTKLLGKYGEEYGIEKLSGNWYCVNIVRLLDVEPVDEDSNEINYNHEPTFNRIDYEHRLTTSHFYFPPDGLVIRKDEVGQSVRDFNDKIG